MKKRGDSRFWSWTALVAMAVTAIPVLPSLFARPDSGGPQLAVTSGESWDVPGEIVVELRESSNPSLLESLSSSFAAGFEPAEPDSSILTVTTPLSSASALLARLRGDSRVLHAEPQHLFRAF